MRVYCVVFRFSEQYTITDKSSDSESSWSVSSEPPSEWRKFWVLLNRSWLQIYRDWVGCLQTKFKNLLM